MLEGDGVASEVVAVIYTVFYLSRRATGCKR